MSNLKSSSSTYDLPQKPSCPPPIPQDGEWVIVEPQIKRDPKVSPKMQPQPFFHSRSPTPNPLDSAPLSPSQNHSTPTQAPSPVINHESPKKPQNEQKESIESVKPQENDQKDSNKQNEPQISVLNPPKQQAPVLSPPVLMPLSLTKSSPVLQQKQQSKSESVSNLSRSASSIQKPPKSVPGCRVKVIIPEFDGTKMAIAYPTQTTNEFIKTLLKYPYDSLVLEELRLLIPMVPNPYTVRGFIMNPDSLIGTYGIGLQLMPVEVPVLILVKKSAEGIYDLSSYESVLKWQSAGLKVELIPSPWCEVLTNLESFKIEKAKKLRKLVVESGIPQCVRGHVWSDLSEATDLVRKCPGLYDSIVRISTAETPAYARKIRVDLCRSMPNHVLFANEDSPGIKSLSRVLNAFARYEYEVGYCQGLNFIGALLLTIMNEEYTFWTLIQLMRKYKMKSFFTMNVPLLKASLSVFQDLINQELPDVAKHFEKEFIPVEAFAASWFQTIFMGTGFPIEIAMRVWDCFMIDGLPFIYRAALAFLKIAREKILKTDVSGLMSILHFEDDTLKDIDPTYFIDLANKIKFKNEVDPIKVMIENESKKEREGEDNNIN